MSEETPYNIRVGPQMHRHSWAGDSMMNSVIWHVEVSPGLVATCLDLVYSISHECNDSC